MIIDNKTNFYLYSGTIGWLGNEGFESFYPEGLPEDWKLAYYNTQFRCVYLPIGMWSKFTESEISALLDETQPGFRFVLESPKEKNRNIVNIINTFNGKCVVEDEVKIFWLEKGISMRELANVMQASINTGHSLYLISRETDLALLRQVNELIEVLGA